MTEHALILCREPGRHSTLDKGHEEGGSAPPGSSVHGDSPGKNTGVGCPALLHGIFSHSGIDPTSTPAPTLQADSLPLSHRAGPRERWSYSSDVRPKPPALSLICCLWPFLCHTTISLQSYDGWSMWTNDEGLMSPDHEGQH